MAAGLHSFSVDAVQPPSPAGEGQRASQRPFLMGILFGGLAMGGLAAVASPGRAGAKFVAAPFGVASLGRASAATDARVGYPHDYHYLDSGASFRGMRLPAQAAGRSTGPVMADAWVRVVPSDQVAVGQQADRLVAGTAVLVGRYSNGKTWGISAKNSATGTEMFGGQVDEGVNTIKDPQWGTQYSLATGDVVGKWCPSPPVIGGIIGAIFPPQGVWVPKVREQGGFIEVQVDVNAKAEFEKKYWKGVLDAQGKADGGYYWVPGRREALATGAAGLVAGVGLLGGASEAGAEVEYPNVKYLGGDSSNLDVNNANIRVYTMLPGLYPNVARKLIAGAPYKGLDDMYARAGFTEGETAAVKKYEKQLLFLEPKPEYVIDNINNGLYK